MGAGVQPRTAGHVFMPDHFDPAPLQQGLHHTGRHRHAADGFDIPAGDRLFIGNDGQCFHHGTRITRRFFRRQSRKVRGELGARPKAPAGGELDQLHAPALPVLPDLVEDVIDQRRLDVFGEQLFQLADGKRLLRGQQRGFQHDLEIIKVGNGRHDSPGTTGTTERKVRILHDFLPAS
ncbi:hypothetical protein D3C85_1296330 [compost metagenome]